MNGKQTDLDKLQALGYGKSKAIAALKDAGGNYRVAVKILNNLALQEEQRKKLKQRVQSKGIAPVVAKPQTTENLEDSPAPKQRTHPCLVQYKKCQYGRFCLLRDYPGDTCINYFIGNCLYGSHCTKQHYVDGVDICGDRRRHMDDATMKLPTGEIVTRTQACGGRVYIGKIVQSAAQRELGCAIPPTPSQFNLIVGSEPSHTDPLVQAMAVEPFIPANAPQPFLNAVRRIADKQQPQEEQEQEKRCRTIRVTGPASDESRQAAKSAGGRPKHPCVAQFGSCRFGKDCTHADRDADVCVRYLNNRCTRGAKCPYRHESNADCLRCVRPDVWGPNAEFSSSSRLEDTHEHHHYDGDDVHSEEHDCKESEKAQPEPLLLSSYLPTEWQETNTDVTNEPSREGACDDAELTALIGLLGAFPNVEPPLLLQALRFTGGDTDLVADVVSRLDAYDSVEAMNAFLWDERAAEEESLQESALRSRHESLLTLCSLFPAIEVASIEAALENCRGDYAEAYGILLCSRESLKRSEYGNLWCGATKPADELRVAQLRTMFPTLPQEVLRRTFGAAEGNFARAVTALNEMTRELLPVTPQREERTRATVAAAATATVHPAASVPAHLPQQTSASAELNKFRAEVDAELREAGDWRRVREKAYIVNTCRLRVLSQAAAAYLRGDGKTAKALSREGKALGAEYVRLNRIAMIALERERLATHPASTLDLHGFHVDEAMEVLRRRVQLCVAKGIQHLTIVVGRGLHSHRGQSRIYPIVLEQLKCDPQLKGTVVLRSVKPAYFEVDIKKNKIQ